jgi:ubiquinone/menaquinone biosynthesis C-methylase UbiE
MAKKTYNQQESVIREADAWNSIADGWHAWIPNMREWYLPATDLMLDLARLELGSHVLDIAAGDCDQSIAASKRIGPAGHVLAIDIAEELLELGGRFARESGFQNIETRVMDGGNLDLPDASFDAVICRFALMYLDDPLSGLRGMKRVLKPNGRVAVVVYGVNGSPEFSRAVAVIRQRLGIPQVQSPAHSLGEEAVLRQSLVEGGFSEVVIHALELPMRMTSAEECVRYLQATSPTLKELTSLLSQDEIKAVWKEVQEALTIYEGEKGFEVIHKVIVAAGSAAW